MSNLLVNGKLTCAGALGRSRRQAGSLTRLWEDFVVPPRDLQVRDPTAVADLSSIGPKDDGERHQMMKEADPVPEFGKLE